MHLNHCIITVIGTRVYADIDLGVVGAYSDMESKLRDTF